MNKINHFPPYTLIGNDISYHTSENGYEKSIFPVKFEFLEEIKKFYVTGLFANPNHSATKFEEDCYAEWISKGINISEISDRLELEEFDNNPSNWWNSLTNSQQIELEKKYGYYGHDIGITNTDIDYFHKEENIKNYFHFILKPLINPIAEYLGRNNDGSRKQLKVDAFSDESQDNIIEKNVTLFKKLREEYSVSDFMSKNKIEVMFDSSQQYLCYINYKEGDGAYGLGTTFLEALDNGISQYKNKFK